MLPKAQAKPLERLQQGYQSAAAKYKSDIQNNENIRIQFNLHYSNVDEMKQKKQFNIDEFNKAQSFAHQFMNNVIAKELQKPRKKIVKPPLIPPLPNITNSQNNGNANENKSNTDGNKDTCDMEIDNHDKGNASSEKSARKTKPQKQKQFACPKNDCALAFTTRQARWRHVRDYHQNKTGDIQCRENGCDMSFDCVASMDRHYNRVHAKRVPFSNGKMCPKCSGGQLHKSHNGKKVFCSMKNCTFNQTFKGEDDEYQYK